MKTVVHPLLIAVLVLPFLSISSAYAGGPGYPPPFASRFATRQLPYLERESHDFLPPVDDDINRINDDRLVWRDQDRDPANPQPPYGSGGANAPLDGGISLLLAAGIGLGLKKAMRKNKSSYGEGTVISSADDQI